ncbi:MAG: hypothetical protein DSM106950_38490 [Stigonema ocellatum SAG 48.90 = DSM 106950]|nr:hypothetical protein [Stigonema ocellatum SAG 48.90 = DSM 106950]
MGEEGFTLKGLVGRTSPFKVKRKSEVFLRVLRVFVVQKDFKPRRHVRAASPLGIRSNAEQWT